MKTSIYLQLLLVFTIIQTINSYEHKHKNQSTTPRWLLKDHNSDPFAWLHTSKYQINCEHNDHIPAFTVQSNSNQQLQNYVQVNYQPDLQTYIKHMNQEHIVTLCQLYKVYPNAVLLKNFSILGDKFDIEQSCYQQSKYNYISQFKQEGQQNNSGYEDMNQLWRCNNSIVLIKQTKSAGKECNENLEEEKNKSVVDSVRTENKTEVDEYLIITLYSQIIESSHFLKQILLDKNSSQNVQPDLNLYYKSENYQNSTINTTQNSITDELYTWYDSFYRNVKQASLKVYNRFFTFPQNHQINLAPLSTLLINKCDNCMSCSAKDDDQGNCCKLREEIKDIAQDVINLKIQMKLVQQEIQIIQSRQ